MLRDLCDALLTGLLPSSLDVVVVQFACETAKKGWWVYDWIVILFKYQV